LNFTPASGLQRVLADDLDAVAEREAFVREINNGGVERRILSITVAGGQSFARGGGSSSSAASSCSRRGFRDESCCRKRPQRHRHGLIAEGKALPITNTTGVITDGRGLRMKAATGVITDGRGLLIATLIGLHLITDGPTITGVQSREPFHPSILTERRHRLIRVRPPSSALSFSYRS
jgi:hypothetical protein